MNLDKIKELNRFVEKNIETIKIGRTYTCIKDYSGLEYGDSVEAIDTAESGFSVVLQVLNEGKRRPVTIPIVLAGLILREAE